MRTGLLFVFLSLPILAASPAVGFILPRGGQRGTDVILTFEGANLSDCQEVLVYYPGISVKKLESVKVNEVKATVTIAADCRLGEHAFRLRTATGLSDLRTFWVGALPIIEEKEPNNDITNPQPIPLNCTVHGLIANEDVDYFAVECKKGQRLSVELEGMRLGTIFLDATITIFNEKQFELAVADDAYITGQDGGTSLIIPADGKYIIQVREAGYAGNARSYYRLNVGHFPRPTAVVPCGGRPGETIEFRFLGDPLGEIKQTIKLPDTHLHLARLHAQNADGVHPAGIKVRINDLPCINEIANANTLATTLVGTTPCAFHGYLSAPGETDYLKIAMKKGQLLHVECFARRLGSAVDPIITVNLMKKDGTIFDQMGENDDVGGPDSQFRFSAAEEGEHCFRIRDHLGQGGPSFFYRVEVHEPRPMAGVRLPRVDGNNAANQDRQTWCVPKGGRVAVPLLLRRADWGGNATLAIEGLPPGVTATVEPVDFASGAVPLILEAKADAANAAAMVLPRLMPEKTEVKEADRATVDVVLAQGGNNSSFHSLATEHVAVAIVDAVPFQLEVVEPKVPVVLGGSMQLKVIIKRAKGFTGPVTVQPVMVPPNVGIAGSTVIAENATECLVSLNAAGNAAPRKWRLAFAAVANTGAGNVWVGSQLFTLEVASAFVAFAQPKSAVEQGQSTQVVCKVATATPFTGKAKATLVGLPPKVTAAPVEFDSGQLEVAFTVITEATAPAGKHSPFCQVVIVKEGETILHNVGGGELRIDTPLVKAAPAAAKPAAPAAPPKPLSRLEQLRKEQEAADAKKKDKP